MPNNIDEENPAKTYLFGPPTNLPEYLKEFAVDEEFEANSILPGPKIATCKGVGGSTHPFLSSDGVKKCIKCEHDVCQYCQEDINKETYCLPCYATESVVPQYEMMVHLRNIRASQQADVEYPLYATSEMNGEVATELEDLIEINFKEGGAFLAEPDLGAKNIPSLFVKFASGSRVDSGYRLLMRCVRHAFDSRAPSLEEQTATLVLHQGDIGIHLNAAIPVWIRK